VREASVGFWSDLARSIFGTQEHRAYGIADEITPVAVLENDRPEWGFLKAEEWHSARVTAAAGGAGVVTQIGLRNAPNSGVLAIITDWNAYCTVGQDNVIEIGWETDPVSQAAFVASGTAFRDGRFSQLQTTPSAVEVVLKNSGALPASIDSLGWLEPITYVQAGAGRAISRLRGPIVLPPGSVVACWQAVIATGAEAANVGLAASLVWRVRPLHKGLRA
jgi:hypothetical protein